jgi:hypothetical protein
MPYIGPLPCVSRTIFRASSLVLPAMQRFHVPETAFEVVTGCFRRLCTFVWRRRRRYAVRPPLCLSVTSGIRRTILTKEGSL